MNIYLFEGFIGCDESDRLGVFTTKELARQAFIDFIEKHGPDGGGYRSLYVCEISTDVLYPGYNTIFYSDNKNPFQDTNP